MSALYWRDFDCTPTSRAIEHDLTTHEHHADERGACLAFLAFIARSHDDFDAGHRYVCIRGPGGLVRGVRR